MKTILFASVLSFSFSSLACPDLAGKYLSCTSTSSPGLPSLVMSNVRVTQKVDAKGVTSYRFDSKIDGASNDPDIYKVDGKVLATKGSHGTVYSVATCDKDILTVKLGQMNGNQFVTQEDLEYTKLGPHEIYIYMNVGGMGTITVNCK